MTCLPLSISPNTFFCGCSSAKRVLNTAIKWSAEWKEASQSVVAIKRTLCNTESGWCLNGMFKKNLAYLLQHYAPLDSQIEVSAKWGTNYVNSMVRLHYAEVACAWVPHADDLISPWVKFDMIQTYIGIGLLLRKRCDVVNGQQYMQTFHASSSTDEGTWDYIGRDVQTVYQNISFTWWFGRNVTGRFWKIEPMTYTKLPAMQTDFIGYIVLAFSNG